MTITYTDQTGENIKVLMLLSLYTHSPQTSNPQERQNRAHEKRSEKHTSKQLNEEGREWRESLLSYHIMLFHEGQEGDA